MEKNSEYTVPGHERLSADIVLAEKQLGLTAQQLEVIYDQRWFKMFVPRSLGGLALELPEALRLQEDLAYLDGSLGWTVTLCAGAGWFSGFMDPGMLETVFLRRDCCLGGSGLPSGTAENLPGEGYRVNGTWRYATGAPHNTVFTANCVITQNGQPLLDEKGQAQVRSFYFYRDEVELIDDWNTMGLRATGSHSFALNQYVVSTHRCFDIDALHPLINDPIYRYPFDLFAEVTLGVNHLGMMRRFLDFPIDGVGSQRVQLAQLKGDFYEMVSRTWESLQTFGHLSPDLIQQMHLRTRAMVHQGQLMVAKGFIRSGMKGAQNDSAINRVWRDLFTASQHLIFRV